MVLIRTCCMGILQRCLGANIVLIPLCSAGSCPSSFPTTLAWFVFDISDTHIVTQKLLFECQQNTGRSFRKMTTSICQSHLQELKGCFTVPNGIQGRLTSCIYGVNCLHFLNASNPLFYSSLAHRGSFDWG